MSKRSPGPWRLRLSSVIAADGYEVGCIWKGDSPSDKPRDDANARLIAAAPDLLAALKLAYRELNGGFDSLTAIEHKQAHELARAAIAKAEGAA